MSSLTFFLALCKKISINTTHTENVLDAFFVHMIIIMTVFLTRFVYNSIDLYVYTFKDCP